MDNYENISEEEIKEQQEREYYEQLEEEKRNQDELDYERRRQDEESLNQWRERNKQNNG